MLIMKNNKNNIVFDFFTIKTKLEAILKELKKMGINYEMATVDLWPEHNHPLSIQLWDGKHFAKIIDTTDSRFSITEFASWFERKKILFQKFHKF